MGVARPVGWFERSGGGRGQALRCTMALQFWRAYVLMGPALWRAYVLMGPALFGSRQALLLARKRGLASLERVGRKWR